MRPRSSMDSIFLVVTYSVHAMVEVRAVYAWGPWQRGLCGRRAASPRPQVLRTTHLSHGHSRRHAPRHSPLPQGTDALPWGQLSLRQRYLHRLPRVANLTSTIKSQTRGSAPRIDAYRGPSATIAHWVLFYIHLYSHKAQLQKQEIKKAKEKETHNVSKSHNVSYAY